MSLKKRLVQNECQATEDFKHGAHLGTYGMQYTCITTVQNHKFKDAEPE